MLRNFLTVVLLCYAIAADAKDYKFYYRQTQLAEESMFDGNFPMALKHYDSAFRKYEFRFARDCYMAAQIAASLRNDSATYRYLTYCIKAGIKYDCLFRPRVLQNFAKSSYALKLAANKDQLWKAYILRIDTGLNREFTHRFDLEQYAKNKHGEAYYRVVDDNFSRIRYLLAKGKYPGEQLMGLRNSIIPSTKPPLFENDTCSYSSELALPTLLHFPYSIDSLDAQLLKARDEGALNPWEYVTIYIFSSYRHCIYRNNKVTRMYQPPLIFNLPFEKAKTTKETANLNRYNNYLPRIDKKLTRDSLLRNYGIAVGIGDYADFN